MLKFSYLLYRLLDGCTLIYVGTDIVVVSDHMVVGFKTTYAISDNHNYSC